PDHAPGRRCTARRCVRDLPGPDGLSGPGPLRLVPRWDAPRGDRPTRPERPRRGGGPARLGSVHDRARTFRRLAILEKLRRPGPLVASAAALGMVARVRRSNEAQTGPGRVPRGLPGPGCKPGINL